MINSGSEQGIGSSLAFGASSSLSSCQTCGCAEESCEACRTPGDCVNCASCCCNTAHQTWRHTRIGNGIRVEYLSSAWMLVEVFGSIGFGLIAGSFALLAFGGGCFIELVFGMAGLRRLQKDFSLPDTGAGTNMKSEHFSNR